MDYKVCILAAGAGTRMGDLTNHINKTILPVNFKASISYIVEKFADNVEIIIAVGHKKETVKDYLTLAYPEKKLTFVEVDNYVGPGTGPGYSLLQCKNFLQSPFIFFAADTIVLEEVPDPDYNWFGIAPVKETEPYCTVRIRNNLIYQLDDKTKNENKFAFIGLAGVYDYRIFFESLENNKIMTGGEVQVSNGFKSLIDNKLVPVGFTWFDTGTVDNYVETNKNFSEGKKFDFSKSDEYIYFVNGRVIKYFADEKVAQNRYKRATSSLYGLCPKMEGYRGNFYSYHRVNGQTLYSLLNPVLVKDFLQWAKLNLWKKSENYLEADFKNICRDFYYTKTMSRVQMFNQKTCIEDGESLINGVRAEPLKDLLAKIDWEYLSNGTPVNFHGDLQFDNILVVRDEISNLNKFVLLDWRQDFSGSIDVGDLYYDLAKLYGGTLLSYQLIKEGMFSFDMSGSSVYYNFYLKNDLLEAREEYEAFILRNNFDLKKIKLLTALIFLNMSPLHNDPFDLMLYFMGKNMLNKLVNNKG
jgi:UTP-glucose-1-phosphate uridylyltransferase